jgi:hypothetical protein
MIFDGGICCPKCGGMENVKSGRVHETLGDRSEANLNDLLNDLIVK